MHAIIASNGGCQSIVAVDLPFQISGPSPLQAAPCWNVPSLATVRDHVPFRFVLFRLAATNVHSPRAGSFRGNAFQAPESAIANRGWTCSAPRITVRIRECRSSTKVAVLKHGRAATVRDSPRYAILRPPPNIARQPFDQMIRGEEVALLI